MGKIIAISNHKGGVGKTTSTVNIGAGLRMHGKRVLLIDLDPQANLTQSLGIVNTERTVYGVLKGKYKIAEAVYTAQTGQEIVPSELDLSGAEVELSMEAGREFILKEQLYTLRDRYDYLLIDCPPSLGLLTLNALTASDEIYLPLQAEFLAVQGLKKLTEIVEKVKMRLNPILKIGGVFITQFDIRRVLNRNVLEIISKHFGDSVFDTKIRDNIALAEAPTMGQDIFAYSPKSYGAEDYAALCEEILRKG